MAKHQIRHTSLILACALLTLSACAHLVGPSDQCGLAVALVFPDEDHGALGKAASIDTAGTVTQMELVVTTQEGKEIAKRPFSRTDKGWEVEAALTPAVGLTVRVTAWHHDAIIYAGADTGVSIEAGMMTTACVQLESYRPQGRLVLTRDARNQLLVYVDPRGSTDRVSSREGLRVRYDWEDDGSWNGEYGPLIPQIHEYPGSGTYRVRAAVRNAAGLVAEVTGEVILPPQAPPLNPALVIDPPEGSPGTLFTADARQSLTGLSVDDSVRFRWDWNGDEAWDTPWLTLPVAKVQLAELGTYRVRMEMSASQRRQAIVEAQAVVRASAAPVVARLVVSPVVTDVGKQVRLDASGSTVTPDAPAAFRWDWDGDGQWDTGWGQEPAVSITYQTTGVRRVTVEVMNGPGRFASATGQVVVSAFRELSPGQEVIVDDVRMRYVSPGTFPMGERNMTADEFPVHPVTVRGFLMDRYEVTNTEYQRFVTATGYAPPTQWIGDRYPAGQGSLPVVNVSWNDAAAYALWRGARLPTEQEWEYAARGAGGRIYPWGNQMEDNRANFGLNPVKAVGQYPAGTSPFGLEDMAGNVWEWTASAYRPYPGFNEYTLIDPSAGGQYDEDRYLISANPFTSNRLSCRVARGGSASVGTESNGIELRSSNREPLAPETRNRYLGFRCVKDLE